MSLQIEHLKKHFGQGESETQVLKDLNFEVKEGD